MRPRGKLVYVVVGICHKKVIVERMPCVEEQDRFTGLPVADVMRGGYWILSPDEVALKRGSPVASVIMANISEPVPV